MHNEQTVPNNVIIVKLGIMHSTGWYWHTNRGGIYRIPSHHVYCDNYLEFSTVQLVRKLRDHVRVGHDKKTKICWVKSDHFKVTWSSASTKTNTNFCLLYKFIWPCHYLGQRRWTQCTFYARIWSYQYLEQCNEFWYSHPLLYM